VRLSALEWNVPFSTRPLPSGGSVPDGIGDAGTLADVADGGALAGPAVPPPHEAATSRVTRRRLTPSSEAHVPKTVLVRSHDLDVWRAALTQARIARARRRDVTRAEHDAAHAARAVGVRGRSAGGHAHLAQRDVLDEEGERRDESRDLPCDRDAVGAGAAAVLDRTSQELTQPCRIRAEVIGGEREIGPAAAAFGDGLPGMFPMRGRDVVKRDELEVRAVGETDERVVRQAAGVLAAGRDGEAAVAVLGDGTVEIGHDQDDVVDAGDHIGEYGEVNSLPWKFLMAGLTSFGAARWTTLENAFVRSGLIEEKDFFRDYAVSSTLPGPTFVNLAALCGMRLGGVRLALTAIVLLLAPGLVAVVLVLAYLSPNEPWVQHLFNGVIVGGIGVSGTQLMRRASRSRGLTEALLASATLVLIALGAPMIVAVLGTLAAGVLWYRTRPLTLP